MNTLLLVCKYNGAEFLAAATTAQTPFRLPAENAAEVTEYTIRPQLTLSNSDTVSTVVDPVSPATNERVDDEVKKLQDQIDKANTDRKGIWEKIANLVDKSTNQTIAGIKTFTSTIVGNISGNAGSATKLKTPQKVTLTGDASGSVSFDGTQAVGLTTTLTTISQNNTTSSVSPNYNETFTTVDSVKRDTKGRVTGANTKTVKLPVAYVHPNVSQSDTTSAEAPNNGSTFEVVDSIKRNGQGHITGVNTKTVTMPTQTNVTGNAATATKLKTARKINGTEFDGTQDINVKATNDSDIVHKSGSESISGAKAFTGGVTARQIPSPTDTQTASAYGVRQVTTDGKDGQLQYIVRTNPQIVETANGFSIGISAGANSIYAGGEAHIALLKAIQTPETTPPILSAVRATTENAIVVADNDTYIGTNYQNGATNPTTGYWWKFSRDGKLYMPDGTELSNKYPYIREIPEITINATEDVTAKMKLQKSFVYFFSDTYAELHLSTLITLGKVQAGKLSFVPGDLLPEMFLSNFNFPQVVAYLDKTKIHNFARFDFAPSRSAFEINLDLTQLPTNDSKDMALYNMIIPLYIRSDMPT
ncbi:hypothetical protein V6B05_01630 [Lactococcus garvieae]|uniref:hypothetical protein n=1 Tax=Lactococcus garvieae TaxID=1363 RepID=UPI001F61377B|nr:hypothetical protein [Lactococcus garvieae]MCI3860128.1 hypothetical protein [Lactococcus garvieae]